jgi:hypothetical protein
MGEEMMRRVRYWLGQAQDALDQSALALDSVKVPLAGNWRAECKSDVAVIGDKLAKLADAIKQHR